MAVNPEKMVMDWLNGSEDLKEYPAAFDVPASASSTHPQRFITVERTGGDDGAYVSRPIITVQVWSDSRWNASQTAHGIVLPRLENMWRLPAVAKVDLLGVTNFPSVDGHPRYQISIHPIIQNDLMEE